MALNWRNCSGWIGCVRHGAIVGVVAADMREDAADNAIPMRLNRKDAEKEEKMREEFNTKTPRLRGTEIVLF